jgi:hypothetical protein
MGISHAHHIESQHTMNSYKTAVAIAIGTLFAGAALAQSNYSIEQRDRIEQQRIDRGVQSGQLTSREADRLQAERAQIERLQRRARADGTLTRNERARIDGAQDRLGRDIYRQAHDRQIANNNGRPHGWDRGNGNGWGRGNDNGRGNDWGRGNDHRRGNDWGRGNDHRRGNDFGRANSNDHRQFDHRGGVRGDRNQPQANGTSPRFGGDNRANRSDRGASRQATMPQAQARSTPSRGTRTAVASRQGGDAGRRTR